MFIVHMLIFSGVFSFGRSSLILCTSFDLLPNHDRDL